jgi:serine/threonine protein kinase
VPAPQSFGPYLVHERLGVGARSEVLLARLRAGGPPVALKRVLAGQTGDAEATRSLEQEAELIELLAHPGVPKVVARGAAPGGSFVAYELIRGRDLDTIAARARERGVALGGAFAITLALELAAVLEHVHGLEHGGRQLGLVHRDVCPSNVMVGFDGHVRLVDFGIARSSMQSRTTGIGEVKGTVRYMSPEQVRGEELDARSDLYALGVLLLELLAGKPVFEGLRPVDVLERIASGSVPDPAEVAPGLEQPMLAILRKVLAQKPKERYDTAAHLIADLRSLAPEPDGEGIVASTMAVLFPVEARSSAQEFEESLNMAEEKGGSDLDVFEGLAKKSTRSPSIPDAAPPSMPPSLKSGGAAPLPPPVSPVSKGKSTLLGVPAPFPANPPTSVSALPPPSIKPPNLPPPGGSRSSSSPSIPAVTPPALPSAAGATPLPAPLPPPISKAPQTLVAAVPPPPNSIGSQLGLGSEKEKEKEKAKATADLEEITPPKPTDSSTDAATTTKGATVNMDWEDEEESTHVFEKQKHAMGPSGPRPAAGTPPPAAAAELGPVSSKVGSAAALMAGSGGTAAPRSVPPPAAPAAPSAPPPAAVHPAATTLAAVPAPPPVPVASAQPPLAQRGLDENTSVRSRDGGGKLGVILGALALVAVVALGVFMLMPRSGQLKIEVKAKSGKSLAKSEIFVDGQKRCDTSPCVVSELSPGPKTIKVIAEGIEPVDTTETVDAGKEKLVVITLDDRGDKGTTPDAPVASGTGFKASSSQAGVRVLVDGKERGTLPVNLTDLEPGQRKLRFEGNERLEPLEKTIEVEKGKLTDLGDIQLKVLKGRLTLELDTEGAEVVLSSTINGKKVEKKLADSVWKSPPVRIDIDTKDQWALVATKKGLEDFKREISFDDGAAEKTIRIKLSEKGEAPIELSASSEPTTPAPGPGPGPAPGPKPTATAATTATAAPKDPPKDPAASGQGTLNMNSIPISKVVMNGRPLGSTPQSVKVPPGSYTVVFIHPEKGKQSRTVTVQAGKTATAAVKFP